MPIAKPSRSFLLILALLALFALAPITLSIVYYHFGGLASEQEQRLQRNLRFAFMKGVDIIDLAPLMEGDWVKVCAIETGLSRAEVDQVVGFAYARYGDIRWIDRPEYWTLLFIDAPKQLNAGNIVSVMPIRVQRREVANLLLPPGVKGQCVGRTGGRLNLLRRLDAPAGESPVVVRLVDFGGPVPEPAPPPEPASLPQR